MEKDETVLIKVETSTREGLKHYGIKSDTYNDIIKRLMKRWPEGARFLNEEVEQATEGKRHAAQSK